MGFIQNPFFCFKIKHLVISLAFLLISSFNHKTFMAQGRSIPNSAEVYNKGREGKLRERILIGSRPPRCERRCSSCVECKAIQVPVVPHLMKPKSRIPFVASNTRETLNSRSDDLSNYKPMSWKCKCGNLILNP
ncbi:hypothetical protein V2J09_017091 [Rumex salicifolius]